MERIVILIDPSGVERAALDFACYLTKLTGSKLTGLFLQGDTPAAPSAIPEHNVDTSGEGNALQLVQLVQPVTPAEQNKTEFRHFCENHRLRWTPDIVDAWSTDEVIIESRFADLMIVNSNASFYKAAEAVPTELVTFVLKNAECPVLISPLSFSEITEIVFSYDGTPSSVYAIKQFTHLFPQLQDKKVIFLEVNEDFTKEIQYREKITDYLKMHYSAIGYQVLTGVPEDELFSYFLHKKNVFVVMGAFGKRIIPSIFRRSTAQLLLKTTSLPVFITHR